MLTVYGRATSSNVQALLWGLEELGLTYTRLDYGEVYGGLDTPEFRAMTPHGKIPVLKLGDTALFETAAILRFLATAHGAEDFWPSDPLHRAEIDMWAEWAKYSVAEAFTGPVFWRNTRTAPERRDPALIARNLAAFEAQLAIAEHRLAATDYLCGSTLTLADILDLRLGGARLAVLSACETGITGTKLPDEVVSLPSGFAQAGVAGVVASLWAVNDMSTAMLMERFYRHWREDGLQPADALRRAQIWLRDATNEEMVAYFEQDVQPMLSERMPAAVAADFAFRRVSKRAPDVREFAHPFWWAAFTMTGV